MPLVNEFAREVLPGVLEVLNGLRDATVTKGAVETIVDAVAHAEGFAISWIALPPKRTWRDDPHLLEEFLFRFWRRWRYHVTEYTRRWDCDVDAVTALVVAWMTELQDS